MLAAFLFTVGFGLWGTALAWVLAVITGLVAAVYFLQRLFPAIGRKNIQPMPSFLSVAVTGAVIALVYAVLMLGTCLEEADQIMLEKSRKRLGLLKN